jgi:hypothetical protein
MRYLQVGGLAAGLASDPSGLGNIEQFVRGAPAQAAGMMQGNPAIGPALGQSFGPGQVKDLFSPIGVGRNEQNPMMGGDNKSPLPVTPVGGGGGLGGGGGGGFGGYAHGGYVTEAGYYEKGGSSERVPLPRPNPLDQRLYEHWRKVRPGGRPASPEVYDPFPEGWSDRLHPAPEPRNPFDPTRSFEVPYTEGSQRFGRPSGPISRQEYLSPVGQLSYPVPQPPDQMRLTPEWMNTTRGSRAAGAPVPTPGSFQRGGSSERIPLPRPDPRPERQHFRTDPLFEWLGRLGQESQSQQMPPVPTPGSFQRGGSSEPIPLPRPDPRFGSSNEAEEYHKRGLIYAPYDKPLRKRPAEVPYFDFHQQFPTLSPGSSDELFDTSPFENRRFYERNPLQRGGGLGIPQMNTMGSQAHYSAINLRPAIGRTPGVHLMASSSVPGRTDRIPMRASPGSYVLPADVVSGLGQGNTHAGARMWGQAISAAAGPAGAGTMGAMRRGSLPKPPQMRMTSRSLGALSKGFAEGGAPGIGHNMGPPLDEDEYVPIVTAGGEVLIDPEVVAALGNGSEILGKRRLAESVLKVRKQTIREMKRLPSPVK